VTPAAATSLPSGGMTDVPWQLSVPLADVYVVGYGNRLPNDFSLEMLAVLKRCRRVFGAPPIHMPGLGLAPMESLMAAYRSGRRRADVHDELAETVLAAAEHDAPVAFATYGSAMVGMPACHLLLARAPRRGLSVHVTAAPSSLDGVWTQLGLDPLSGIEIWDATAFMELADEPDRSVSLLLAQVGLMEMEGISRPIAALRDRLLCCHDADHEVHFVTVPGAARHVPHADIETLRLGELVRGGRKPLSTLLVPGCKRTAQSAGAAAPAIGCGQRHAHAERRTR
jgi:uncharacterized protein YabN with tetrapyrrole methylase and pyrophosphatase domain